ncbi:MAG: pirin family protein [Wenzhouxiangellaceae bacterium]
MNTDDPRPASGTWTLAGLFPARRAADGDGVRLYRSLGAHQKARVDPFLLLDEFGSDQPDDYIGGFPAHPHRGFCTVTILRAGTMEHRDHLGNSGVLGPGDVQWMRAGRGIIHSEMPRQREGRMHGFQLWINLPAAHKMDPPDWRDIRSDEIPLIDEEGTRVTIIAGRWQPNGPTGPLRDPHTGALIAEIELSPGKAVALTPDHGHHVVLYPYAGQARVAGTVVASRHAAWLTGHGPLRIQSGPEPLSALLLTGKPIGEPIAQLGPFVMNSREEVEQAMAEWRAGRLTG